uniref:Large ribosomal subunit protein uL24c n=1 Tax=Cumathamnion serrulatum TaxID=1206573 RepID=A0A7U1AR54_9FLOR|nr:50S ribosomal protein L24 [Cumathamnion serrulatum]QQY85395.1 50S ribosomal protein L24 [Cumathamnion serrulatum]
MKKIKRQFTIGEKIKVISGKHKGKIGKVKKILSKQNSLIVENINFKTKHIKPKQNDEKGQIIKIEASIHSSNTMKYKVKDK